MTIVSIVLVTGSDGGFLHGDGQVEVLGKVVVQASDDGVVQVKVGVGVSCAVLL